MWKHQKEEDQKLWTIGNEKWGWQWYKINLLQLMFLGPIVKDKLLRYKSGLQLFKTEILIEIKTPDQFKNVIYKSWMLSFILLTLFSEFNWSTEKKVNQSQLNFLCWRPKIRKGQGHYIYLPRRVTRSVEEDN